MRSAAEQIQSQLFIGARSHDHHAQRRILAKQFGHRFHRIRCQRRFKNQHVGGKFRGCRLRLRQRLRLPHHANVIFERENFPQAGAENGLCIGHNHADELAFAAVLACSEIFFHAHRNRSHSFLAPTLVRNGIRQSPHPRHAGLDLQSCAPRGRDNQSAHPCARPPHRPATEL